MELTKTKLNNILKKYRKKLEDHEQEWIEICKKARMSSTDDYIVLPTIYDHEHHNSKGNQLFISLMKEFEKYEVFPKKDKK